MRLSQILIQTLREDPSDAEIPSHKLLARAGFIVQLTTVLVPLGESLLLRRPLPARLWVACAVATAGVAQISLAARGHTRIHIKCLHICLHVCPGEVVDQVVDHRAATGQKFPIFTAHTIPGIRNQVFQYSTLPGREVNHW